MNNKIYIVLGVVAVILVAVFVFSSNNDSLVEQQNTEQAVQNPGEQQQTVDQIEGNMQTSQYQSYSEANLAAAFEDNRKIVIFFHADWCPTCRVLDGQLSAGNEQLPEDLVILKADYDSDVELRRKYGVTQQHTLVQIDSESEEIKKWIGGGVETIVQQLN